MREIIYQLKGTAIKRCKVMEGCEWDSGEKGGKQGKANSLVLVAREKNLQKWWAEWKKWYWERKWKVYWVYGEKQKTSWRIYWNEWIEWISCVGCEWNTSVWLRRQYRVSLKSVTGRNNLWACDGMWEESKNVLAWYTWLWVICKRVIILTEGYRDTNTDKCREKKKRGEK